MELGTIFLIWIVITIIDNVTSHKKRRLPPPEESKFDIPPLEEPNENIIFEKPAKIVPPTVKTAQVEVKSEPQREIKLNLTPSSVKEALLLSEILGKPKSLRRR